MKRNDIIKLTLVILLFIVGFTLKANAQSEQEIVTVFKGHNLPELTKFILNNDVTEDTTFYVGEKRYDVGVNVLAEPSTHTDINDITYYDSGKKIVTISEMRPHGSRKKNKVRPFRTYEFYIDDDGFQVYSDNLFFKMKYRPLTEAENLAISAEKDVILSNMIFDLQEDQSTYNQLILYGFLYAYNFDNEQLIKVADYVVE